MSMNDLKVSPTQQQLGEVGRLDVVVVHHGGRGRDEPDEGWHEQVEMGGAHPPKYHTQYSHQSVFLSMYLYSTIHNTATSLSVCLSI